MGEAIDAVAEAMAKNRQLAASCLVRKQDAEAALAKLKAAGETGPAVEAAEADVADADAQLQAALAEMKELKKLAAQVKSPPIGAVAGIAESDPLIRTLEEQALDNVRAHIADRDAQARLGAELSADPLATTPAAPAAPRPTAADKEAEAKRKFEEMRARLGKAPPTDATPPPSSLKPKKTL